MEKMLGRLSIAAIAIAVPVFANASLTANFDSFTEGDVFDTFTDAGIRFFDVMRHQDSYTNFAIENASDGYLGSSMSSPNVLGFGGYLVGPGEAFGAFGGMSFTSDTEATTAGLDVWTLPLIYGGNTITLTGYMGGVFVDSVSFSFDNAFSAIHQRLDLPQDHYDTFRLSSSGPAVMGDSFIDVDNVTVAPVPEPASLVAVGIGLAFLTRRRRASRK